MFKYSRLMWVVLLCVMVGVAFGAARKISSFTPVDGFEGIEADGMAILNYSSGGGGKTIVQIIVSDFTPNTVYDVALLLPGELPLCAGDVLVTDDKGHGNAHFEIPFKDATSADIDIYTDLGCVNEQLRAFGMQ